MDKKSLISEIFNRGKESGMEDMEVFIHGSKTLDIAVFKGEIDKYSISDEEGLSFRGTYEGRMGYSYTERLDFSSIDMLVSEAIENAKIIDSKDEELLFEGSPKYETIDCFNEGLESISTKDKISLAVELENIPYSLDSRVTDVDYCAFQEQSSYNMIVNTKGLALESKKNISNVYLSVMVKDGDDVKTAESYEITNDFSQFNPSVLAKTAVDEALSLLGAESIKSGVYPVILRNDVMANILEAFAPIFSAENVQKDLSLLKDKLNSQIANEAFTLVDDPFMKGGAASRAFDGEGVATKYKEIIKEGILQTYLHNLKTARKAGIESTGNGYKGSYKSPVSISPTNMYVINGKYTFEELMKDINEGLLIINVQGLHSGLNTVSGDFSLSAYGYEIEKGKIKRPVNQITIAGNFFDLLKDIEMIANDLKFVLPSSGHIGSPSVKVKGLSVAGK